MRLPFSLIAIALLFLSCETSPTKNTVDLKDIKAICDDLDFQFDHLSLSDSLNIYSKKINLSNHEVDPVANDLETRKRIRKKSNPKMMAEKKARLFFLKFSHRFQLSCLLKIVSFQNQFLGQPRRTLSLREALPPILIGQKCKECRTLQDSLLILQPQNPNVPVHLKRK